jgi:multiple sugar transport system permease protein
VSLATSLTAATAAGSTPRASASGASGLFRPGSWNTVGLLMVLPYLLIFFALVLYPVVYGFWLARHPESYVKLVNDPVFGTSIVNTLLFLLVVVNIKFALALFLSGFFVHERPWIRWLSLLFILPWAVPSIPTILSFRFMFNPEWGVVNSLIFKFTQLDGPNWLNDRWIGSHCRFGHLF